MLTLKAFANTDGGFIVFGVREKGNHFDIVGRDNDKEFANRFGQKISALPANPGFVVAILYLSQTPRRF